jgi:hypothetical protein
LDLQTLLLELLIPASDGLSKTLDNVEIHLKSPRYPETRFSFFSLSAAPMPRTSSSSTSP